MISPYDNEELFKSQGSAQRSIGSLKELIGPLFLHTPQNGSGRVK
jgi:hypothetical protein